MNQDLVPPDPSTSFASYVPARFEALIWSCLDAELARSAVFYAERYFSLDRTSHPARHLYATSLLRCGQIHSAMHAVNLPADQRCSGCAEIKAKCCTGLGRYSQAREALEESLSDQNYFTTSLSSSREAMVFPDEAVLHCRAGSTALKANMHDKAASSFRKALKINPMIWEAFEGLCAVGDFPDLQDLFPVRPPPVKQGPDDLLSNAASSSKPTAMPGPVASGAGFFTPDVSNIPVRGWKPEPAGHQPFRMQMLMSGRESFSTNESFMQSDISISGPKIQLPKTAASTQSLLPRPLSSAEEAGPVLKKPRSQMRHPALESSRLKQTVTNSEADSRSKKARARPVLMFDNLISCFSSSKRNSQPNPLRAGKGDNVQTNAPTVVARKSKRLLSGAGEKQQSHVVKHPPLRERKRAGVHGRSRSTESEMEDDFAVIGDVARSPSPPSTHSPRSDQSAPQAWTAAQEQAAQEAYDATRADIYVYDLMRLFASAVRALAMYDCKSCLAELDELPEVHQRSSSVMAMVGRARYEKGEYLTAERFFHGARTLEPYRLWDMEAYSTTLWHLQKSVQLSFLAQELLSIDPRSPQAWIAVGNCFSLQKERNKATTCFERAAQLDPSCAYAYTLSGHEYTEDDLDKAVNFYQSALRADPRHYNAWYGLGTCYLRMNKLRLAEYHFRRASAIHPSNAVLLGCVGMAVERRGGRDEAFGLYSQAVELSPDNALVRYQRAKILIGMRRYKAAIEDLERLRDSTPEEANVVFQLAKVYRLVGEDTKAAQMLAIARDMSPKSANKIKRLLEIRRDEGGEDEMDEG